MRFLRILAGRQLACGCLVGTYQLYDGRVVSVLDVRSPGCPYATHLDDQILAPEPAPGSWNRDTDAETATDLSSRLN